MSTDVYLRVSQVQQSTKCGKQDCSCYFLWKMLGIEISQQRKNKKQLDILP